MESQKTQNSQNKIKEENRLRTITRKTQDLLQSNNNYDNNSAVLVKEKTSRLMEQTPQPRNRQGAERIQWSKESLPLNFATNQKLLLNRLNFKTPDKHYSIKNS